MKSMHENAASPGSRVIATMARLGAALGVALGAALGVALGAALLFASCSGGFKLDGSSLLSYAETAKPGLVLNLSRDDAAIFGTWEEPSLSRYGLVEGEAKSDGSLSLRFYGAQTAEPVGILAAAYSLGETRITGKLQFGGDQSRPIVLENVAERVAGLRLERLHASSSKGLAKTEPEPTRFFYLGFEPRGPVAFRDWYRKTFQGGQSLSRVLSMEGKTFIEDFEATTKDRGSQLQSELLHAWFYDGRQFLSYRGKGLLVMGLRRGIYTGTGEASQSLRFAVMDEAKASVLSPGDFLADGWETALPALLGESLREEFGMAPGASLLDRGFVSDSVDPGRDFIVYSKGLGFHYPPGKMAPAEAGEFFVLLPFDRLGGLLKPGVLETYGLAAASTP